MKKSYFVRVLVLLCLIPSLNYATTYYSRASTAWNVASTWSTGSCGGTAAASTPTASDDVIICTGHTVTMTAGSCHSLTIQGTANWTSTATVSVGLGGININSGGNITGASSGVLTTTGGLVLNSTLTSTTVSIRTITTAGQTISGTGSLGRLDISAATTNNGNITVTTSLLSTVSSTLTQGPGATLNYNGTTFTPGLDASASGNTVVYGGTAQTVKLGTYHHLTISGSGAKTLGGAITVNGNLAVNAGSLATSTYQITGNATGSFTLAASTTFYVGLNSSATDISFPTGFVKANISFNSTSTVVYYGNNAQIISSIPDYGNLTVQTFSGSKTSDGTIAVMGNLVTTSPTTLAMGSNTLGVRGNYTGTGPLSFTSGNFNIGGSYTNTGAFTCGTGTVNYAGTAAQTVRGVNYYNLTFSNTGDKQLQASATIGIGNTFTRGTMVVTPGTSSTVTFTGASPVMTGNATTFYNLTVNGGTFTAPADLTVSNTFTTTSPGAVAMNTRTLTVTGNYTGTGMLSFTSGTFNIGGSYTNSGTFTCGTGLVNYNGSAAQTVHGTSYYNLTFSDAGAKTLQASATISIAGTFARGTMTVTPGSSNTVVFNGGAQTMTGSATTFNNLTLNNTSLSAPADITVNAALASTSPATLNMSSYILTVTGNYTGTGTLTFTSGTFNLNGAFSNTGTFTCGTGTVNYTSSSAQTVRGVNYYNLTFSGTGTKTLQTAATIGVAGTFTRGTMTVTSGATNVMLFNGTSQVMTGNATTFSSLTLNNTSLTIPADITVNTTLTFTAGTITTGAYNVIMASGSTVSRTSGFVVGNLRKSVTTGTNVSRTFEIGSGTSYTPLDVVFSSVTTGGTLTASTTAGDHPSIASSGFNTSLTINRYWTLVNSSIVFTNYNVTATYVNADKDAGYVTANSIIKSYDGSTWAVTNGGTQTANSAQALAITIPATPNTIHLQIGQIIPSPTGNLFSIATNNWSTVGTWSTTSGGASCGCIPTSLDNVTIENNYTVTMNGNAGVAKSLTLKTGGKALFSSALTTNVGTGGITILSTGDITGTGAGTLTTSGGLALNGTITNTAFSIKTIGTSGQTISGTGSIARLDISVNTNNNAALTVTTALNSTTASTLTQGTSGTLTYTGTTAIAPTLDASASGNTVTYNGAAQTIKSATYHNLIISGSGTKTLGGATTVNNNLTVNAGSLATSTYQITGNATGTFTLAASTNLYVGLNSSATPVVFPTGFTNGHISLASTSTVYYYGNNAQTVSSVPTYGHLIIQTFSGSKIADGNITVAGNLTSTTPSILNMLSYNVNVTGNFAGTGGLAFSTGTMNLTGTYSNTGTFTCGTGTFNYAGSGAQTVRGVNYYNLTFSGTGAKTLQAAATIGIAGNFTRGTMTVTPGATNIVNFNGAAQVMTGNTTSFTSVTVNNTSLTIPADITVNSALTLTAGSIITGSYNVILPATGTVSRTSGFVAGNMRKNLATGTSVSRTFEIGTGVDYTPITLLFSSVSVAGNLTVSTTATDHPSVASSGFNPTYTVNRYWTITNASAVYTNYTVTTTFANGDKDPGYNPSNSLIRLYNGTAWTTPTAGTPTSNTAQASGAVIPITPNTIYVQIGDNNPSITGNLYAIANGNWSTLGTWSQNSGGSSCYCTPSTLNDVIIENNYTVTMDGAGVTAKSLTVKTGGKANWTSALTTNIGSGGVNIMSTGDITGSGAGILTTSGGLVLNKALSSTTVTIKTITTAGQIITGTGTLANLDINVNTTNNGNITLTDVLTITAGTLTNSGTFTLKADATKYARIAPISNACGTCGFSGNFTIQRYIPARSVSTWANLSSPVSNSTMADWDNELFLEYPFLEYDYLTGRPTGTNVMAYSEPLAEYVELNASTPLTPGKGFEIGLTSDNSGHGFAATTLTTIGTPNYGTFNIPLSYTAANGPAYPIGYSGENLIGNPYASAIALSAITKTNALAYVDVYDYTTDNYKTLSGSDVIGPYQAFWAYAQGTGASFSITESSKVTTNNKALYRTTDENDEHPFMELTLASADGSNTMAHTFKVGCSDEASDGWDTNDHPFRKSLNPKAPYITSSINNRMQSINMFNSNHEVYVLPLNVKTSGDGKYQLSITGIKRVLQYFKVILLEDKLTHQFINLENSNVYTFTVLSNDSQNRFVLHFSKSSNYKPDSTITKASGDEAVTITKTIGGNTIFFNNGQTEQLDIYALDMMGRSIMYDISAEANSNTVTITLPSNFSGGYIVVVLTENNKTVKKFIQP